jgi:hypothetical protein
MNDEMVARRLALERPTVTPARYVTISLASAVTGFSEKAIRKKIEEQIWQEDREWVRAAGRILIDLQGYERWVERQRRAAVS